MVRALRVALANQRLASLRGLRQVPAQSFEETCGPNFIVANDAILVAVHRIVGGEIGLTALDESNDLFARLLVENIVDVPK